MNDKSPSKQLDEGNISYEVGKECLYWKESNDYVHEQAITEGWLDDQGKLTADGFQAIASEQEVIKKRQDRLEALASKNRGVKGKLKTSASSRKKKLFPSSSSRKNRGQKMYSSHMSSKKAAAKFKKEAKTNLAKLNCRFISFEEKEVENWCLVIEVPNKKDQMAPRAFNGRVSEIRKNFFQFIREHD